MANHQGLFSSDMVEIPFGITAPIVVKENMWLAIWAATAGAGTQEFTGDAIKNNLKEQP